MSAAKCTSRLSGDQTWHRCVGSNRDHSPRNQYSVLSTGYSLLVARRTASAPRLLVLILLLTTTFSLAADSFPDRLSALSAKCDELGFKEQAVITRDWVIDRHPGRQYLFLPLVTDPTAPKSGSPETVTQWHKHFLKLRRDHAAELFAEAKSASDQKQPTRAYQLLFEVLREDPDHAEARRILGYVKAGGQWRIPEWEKATPRQRPLDHPKLGWRARTYWSLETPHFQIVSNHSPRELAEAGRELENLHTLWRQIFFRYWSTHEALAARFAGSGESLAPDRPKMQVVLFKTREEYAAYVAAAHPKAASTLGLYNDKERISYFFAGDTSVYPTWYHEATHQLFQEAIPNVHEQPGQQRNFWALEGAALYMESLANRGSYWTAGGCESDRLQFARYRVLSGDRSLPLARMSSLSRDDIQNSDRLGQIYTHAAGLAHFLIDGEHGKYREAFTELLTSIYRGEDTADSLEKLAQQPLQRLDEQCREFLNVTDDDLAGIPDSASVRNLSLCRTRTTDKGLVHFAATKNLKWLDLSFTSATDGGLKHFAANRNLKQLFLEGTQITAASLPLIARFTQLEELDLSRLPITDNDLAALSPLHSLKTLHLTSCPLTDAALQHLRNFKRLEELQIESTKITPDALNKLRSTLPKLK